MKVTIEGATREPDYLWDCVLIPDRVDTDGEWYRGCEGKPASEYPHTMTIKTAEHVYEFGFEDGRQLLLAVWNFSMREGEKRKRRAASKAATCPK